MEEAWANYFTNVNDKLASIRLDLSLKDDQRLNDRPWLLWVWLYFQAPREDGLSSSGESATLWDIEDAIDKALQEQSDAIHCGCITTCARREFYFYGTTPVGLEESVAAVISKYPPYKVWVG